MPRRSRRLAATVATALATVALGCVPAPPPTPGPVIPGDPGPADLRFEVDTTLDRHSISPYIYGSNANRDIVGNGLTMLRLGGNRWTAYNWENNASNAGSDWCFQNDSYLAGSTTAGEAVRPTVQTATANGAAALVTVPIVDHVAADHNGGSGPPECSGDVRKSGSGYLTTRFEANVADKPGALSTTPDVSDGTVYQEEFVAWLKATAPGANVWFSLDNEPDLWADTHAEIHPSAVRYDELAERSIRFAKAIKSAWPAAKVTGPASYASTASNDSRTPPTPAGATSSTGTSAR